RVVHPRRGGGGGAAAAPFPDRVDVRGGGDLRGLPGGGSGGGRRVNPDDLGRLVERLSFATIDHLRPVTQGHQEVIFCPGKTAGQVVAIAERLEAAAGGGTGGSFLATRADPAQAEALAARFPRVEINELGRTAYLPP